MRQTRRRFIKHGALCAAAMSSMGCSARKVLKEAITKSGLADAYKDDFLIGTAISNNTIRNADAQYLDLIAKEFNAVTAENCQKWEQIQPTDTQWDWSLSDKFVDIAAKNQQHIIGHTLVWHSQIPDSVFRAENGGRLNASELRRKMQVHIETLVGRYKGKIATWDVVNEVVSDEGYNEFRNSEWLQIMGPEFIELAFRIAHDADPQAKLLYNDYSMHIPAKREFLIGVLTDYLDRGVPIHGVGFQGHYELVEPQIEEIEASIEAYAALGLKIHISELDIDVLPNALEYLGAEISTNVAYSEELNPYPNSLPLEVEEQLAERYAEIFKLFIKHRDSIERVSTWGSSDAESWKNDWPVSGRTNYPLLFDRNLQPKSAYQRVLELKS